MKKQMSLTEFHIRKTEIAGRNILETVIELEQLRKEEERFVEIVEREQLSLNIKAKLNHFLLVLNEKPKAEDKKIEDLISEAKADIASNRKTILDLRSKLSKTKNKSMKDLDADWKVKNFKVDRKIDELFLEAKSKGGQK